MIYGILRWIATKIIKMRYQFTFEGQENCPDEGGYIYASNHRSYYDPIFLSLPVKKRFAYMAKEELFTGNKFFGWLIARLGAFPVSRGKGDSTVIDTAVDRLKSGRNLVIFPEGTRSYDGRVGRGKSGVALIAAKAGRDIIPCAIVFDGEKLLKKQKVTVRFGKLIHFNELNIDATAEPTHADLKHLKQRIMSDITVLAERDMPPRIPKQ